MAVRILGSRLACWAALLVIGPAAAASGQGIGKVSFSVAGVASSQGKGKSDCPYLCGPFGGTAPGVAVAAVGRVTPRLDIGLETSVVRAIQGQQQLRVLGGSLDMRALHRDSTITGILRWHPAADRAVNVAAVAGAGLAIRHTTRSGVFRSDSPNRPDSPAGFVVADSRVPDVVVGVDIFVRIAPRILMVPTFRLHSLLDDDRQSDGVVNRGVGSVIARGGLGIEVVF